MIRLWLAIAGLGGVASIVAGTIAAHLAGEDPRAAELLRTGALYGMVHAGRWPRDVSRGAARRRSPDGVLPPELCCSAAACSRWRPARHAGSAG